ncbi:MAG: isoprenylcysteine carboxylmethyltransferase family protein [Opitutaceae bacterium]
MNMVAIGNFFFRYRNLVFILFYAALFLPSAPLFPAHFFGPNYFLYPIIIGLVVTISGQLIRGATIGLAYIIRGGRKGKPYAEGLVTEGIFHHCRNPLYVGNILMLVGMGILSNSLVFAVIVIPLFMFIYQAIVLAEEDFLRGKFGSGFDDYCRAVSRWVPDLRGIGGTVTGMHFNWRRWILMEYNTQFIWLLGIFLVLLFKYPLLTHGDLVHRNQLLNIVVPVLVLGYLLVRFLKKSGLMVESKAVQRG